MRIYLLINLFIITLSQQQEQEQFLNDDNVILQESCSRSEDLTHMYLMEAKRGLLENAPNVRAAQMAVLYAAITSTILGNETHPGNPSLFKELVRVLESTNGQARRNLPSYDDDVSRELRSTISLENKRQNIAIVSLCDYDPSQTKLASLSIHNKVDYTKRHDYDLFVETKSLDTTRPHAWSKIKAVSKYLNTGKYDWVMWMDCDSFFMNVDLRLEHVLNQNYDLIISEDGAMLNSGVFFVGVREEVCDLVFFFTYISSLSSLSLPSYLFSFLSTQIRNTTWSRYFLNRVYGSSSNPLITHPWWEQASMMFWLNHDKADASRHVLHLNQRDINSYPSEIASQLRDPSTGHTLHGEYQDGDFIISFSGCKIYFDKSKCERFFSYYHGVASQRFLDEVKKKKENDFFVKIAYPLQNQRLTRSESDLEIQVKSLFEEGAGSLFGEGDEAIHVGSLCISLDSNDENEIGTCTILKNKTLSFSLQDLKLGYHEIRVRVVIDGVTSSNVASISFEVWDASECVISNPDCFDMSRCVKPTMYV